eukprot:g5840.t1
MRDINIVSQKLKILSTDILEELKLKMGEIESGVFGEMMSYWDTGNTVLSTPASALASTPTALAKTAEKTSDSLKNGDALTKVWTSAEMFHSANSHYQSVKKSIQSEDSTFGDLIFGDDGAMRTTDEILSADDAQNIANLLKMGLEELDAGTITAEDIAAANNPTSFLF